MNGDDLNTPDHGPVERRLTWRRLLVGSGLAGMIVMGLVAAILTDLEAAAVALGFGLSTALLWFRGGMLGAVGIFLISAITLFFMLTAAVTNVRAGSPLVAVLVSSGLTAVALTGLVSAVAVIGRASGTSGGPGRVMGLASAVFIGFLVWSAATPGPDTTASDIQLASENLAFSRSELQAAPGDVTVSMANRDLFWHTFTIEELGVDLLVPVGAELATTFTAAAGTYEFICRIPGHPEAGMLGTLTIAP